MHDGDGGHTIEAEDFEIFFDLSCAVRMHMGSDSGQVSGCGGCKRKYHVVEDHR